MRSGRACAADALARSLTQPVLVVQYVNADLAGLPVEAGARLIDAARAHFSEALAQPLACDALSVFVQQAPDATFDLAWRFPLAEP